MGDAAYQGLGEKIRQNASRRHTAPKGRRIASCLRKEQLS